MRPLLHRCLSELFEPPTSSYSALPDQILVGNARNYNLALITHTLLINYLSGSRTPGTKYLRATVSAWRLCEN